jgi:hypothetical protein
MAVPMLSTQFKNEVAPIMATAFDGVYNLRKDEYKQIFDVRNAPYDRNQFIQPFLYGFDAAPEIAEGQPITYDTGGELYSSIYLYRRFGMAFALTDTLVEDGDHIAIGTTYAKHQAQAIIETKERRCANVLNRAFNSSYPGGDGTTLISSTHMTANGGTFSNVLSSAAVLSQTSFEQILIQIRNAVNANNFPIVLKAKELVVNPSNMMTALTILKSVGRTGTANNDVNPVQYITSLDTDPTVMSRLTSTIAWFVHTDADDGLQVIQRTKLKKEMLGDFETSSMRYKASERYIEGWTDPRTVFGTPAV